MVRKQWIVVLALVLALGLIVVGCGGNSSTGSTEQQQTEEQGQEQSGSAEKIIMRLGHVSTEDNPRGVSAIEWAQAVQKATNGKVEVEIYPAGQLGNNIQMEEAVLQGSLEAVLPTTAFTFNITQAYSIFDLPFLFSKQESVVEFLHSEKGKELLKVVEPKGYKALAMWPTGFKWMTANKPIQSVDDLKGLKFRVMASDVLINQYKAWGASATPMPLPELYNALAQGTVDGQENTFGIIHDFRLYETQKYLVQSEHSLTMDVFLVNKKWFEGLPQDIQNIMIEEAQKITDLRWRWEEERNANLIEAVKKVSDCEFLVLSPEAKKQFKEAAQSVYEEFYQAQPDLKPIVEDILNNYSN